MHPINILTINQHQITPQITALNPICKLANATLPPSGQVEII